MTIRINSLNRENWPDIWTDVRSWLGEESAAQTSARFEWKVAAFAAGIAVYFSLPFEPSLVAIGIICLVLAAAAFRPKPTGAAKFMFTALFFIFLGLGRSTWHSQATAQEKLPRYEKAYWVTGWISAVEKSGPRQRWKIQVREIEGLDAAKTPKIIRTSSGGKGIAAGDFIRIRAILSAPRGPAVPGGYDPARRAFFESIGGTGYAISKAVRVPDYQISRPDRLKRNIVLIRYGLAERVLARAPPETAGLQVGLLTGIRTYITDEQTDTLRIAGLAHILAISGLHMGLMAGSVYFLAALGFASIAPLARRMDVRKIAAGIGIVSASSYLILSGASVATQRAFIMTCIVFLAVLLDRRAFSMRSVALAGLVTLMLHPEAIVGVGFQMSFAAVAALVAVYRAWDARREYVYQGPIGRMVQSFKSLSVTSFVAGTATSGFAMLHFNRFASYGLAGNLFAMPIFTFWVMPAGLAVFPAALIGREDIPLAVMGKGLDLMLFISAWVASWPEAVLYIPAGPGWVIGVFGLAFAAVCLGPRLARVGGLLLVPICTAVWLMAPNPDIRVSSGGAVAFWNGGETEILYVNKKRADRYGREQFARRAGSGEAALATYQDDIAQCDVLGCRLTLKGRRISITESPSEVLAECQTADLVILTRREAGPVARRSCGVRLIDEKILNESGGQNIFLDSSDIRRQSANSKSRSNRPWGR